MVSDIPAAKGTPIVSGAVRARLAAAATAASPAKGPGRPQRLSGLVRPGVERGSTVLLDGRGVLLAQLMGGDPAILVDGATVLVTGSFRRDLLTTVQQGALFQVDSAVALDPEGRHW